MTYCNRGGKRFMAFPRHPYYGCRYVLDRKTGLVGLYLDQATADLLNRNSENRWVWSEDHA